MSTLSFKIIDAIEELTDAPFSEKENTHVISEVENLQTTLNEKTDSGHTHSDYLAVWTQITDRFLNCSSGASEQKGGSKKISASQLPAHSHEIYTKKTEVEGTGYGMIVAKRTMGYTNQVSVSGLESNQADGSESTEGDDYLPPYITVYAWYRTE